MWKVHCEKLLPGEGLQPESFLGEREVQGLDCLNLRDSGQRLPPLAAPLA